VRILLTILVILPSEIVAECYMDFQDIVTLAHLDEPAHHIDHIVFAVVDRLRFKALRQLWKVQESDGILGEAFIDVPFSIPQGTVWSMQVWLSCAVDIEM
jgi:hypothetical protein